ncbi:ABC transporter substrate-binding protein [Evansella tamaricis]|uniref:SgrR family transcriptional regulator n=1 Tax=Evansella tamaricis TaxID=2069301 RepID=A0ABS6JHH1_9BACI|nr:ABC transporter substrate-binding protein [Evansella tamaricis]MBU9711920.1 SgrR family transcriptional regulator [Evansella tamaricis]
MKVIDHYHVLTKSLKEINRPIQVTIEQLSTILHCSVRNTKIVLTKLQLLGWITWIPGRGRGNYSTISLEVGFDSLVLEEAKKFSSIDDSIAFIQQYELSDDVQRDYIYSLFFNLRQGEESKSHVTEDRLLFPSYRPLVVLDPYYVNRRSENHVMRHLYSQLVTYDKNLKSHAPHLAHHWNHRDYTEWTFYLRKGVTFHNGKELTASDVCYSFQRHGQSGSAYHWITHWIKNITLLNRYTMRFTLKKPVPSFLHLIASLGGSIVPEGFMNQSVGTGPFQVQEQSNHKLTLVSFPAYFHLRPLLDEVTMYFFPNLYDNQQDNHFSESVNFFHYPYSGQKTTELSKDTMIDKGSKLLTLNMNKKLTNDPYLRKVIYLALDSEKMIHDLGGNRFITASRMDSQLETGDNKRHKTEKDMHSHYLKDGRYNGETLALYTYAGAGNEADGEWIQTRLGELGIRCNLHVYSYNELHQLPLREQSDLLLGEQLADESLLYTYLSSLRGNHSLASHHLTDQVREQIEDTFLEKRRERDCIEALQQIEAELSQSHHLIYLYRLQQFAIHEEHLENIHLNALGWVDYTKLWYKRH